MFHIKEDKRVQRSANLIVEGLIRCLKDKPFMEITISDIQRESSVSRTTIYRLFDNSTDILHYKCDLLGKEIVEKFHSAQNKTRQEFLPFIITFWIDRHEFLEAIFASGRADILQLTMFEHIKSLSQLSQFRTNSDKEKNYMVTIATSIISGILMAWIREGKSESADEIEEICIKAVKIAGMSFE